MCTLYQHKPAQPPKEAVASPVIHCSCCLFLLLNHTLVLAGLSISLKEITFEIGLGWTYKKFCCVTFLTHPQSSSTQTPELPREKQGRTGPTAFKHTESETLVLQPDLWTKADALSCSILYLDLLQDISLHLHSHVVHIVVRAVVHHCILKHQHNIPLELGCGSDQPVLNVLFDGG